jgi:FkbM family methyltransferase
MPYMPSVFRINKYGKYLMYCSEYINRWDWLSVKDSLNYLFFKRLPNRDRKVETEMGYFLLRSYTNDFQFVNWTYERKIKDHLEEIKDRIGLFIDVGACIGEYCIWLGNYGIQCLAIEPINNDAIEDNLRYNSVAEKNIIILPVAVGKENKNVAFNRLEGVTSSSHIDPNKNGNIPCYKLDELVKPILINPTKITFIKLDVEGAEMDALEGAVSLITNVRNLQIVYEHTSVGDREIRSFLDKWAEFSYTDLDGVNTLAIKKQP